MSHSPARPSSAQRTRVLDRSSFDVIVVGSGVGGLVAAALLARSGRSVLVVDRHYVAGGNATIFKRPGYEFDVGVHYLGECSPSGLLPRILRAAGAAPIRFLELDPDGFDRLVFPGLEFRVPRGLDAYRKRLVEVFPSEHQGIDRYVRLLRDVRSLASLGGRPLSALWVLPRAHLALRHLSSTLAEFLDSCTRDPRLRAVLAGQQGLYGLPPERVSAVMHAAVSGHYVQGAFYPEGGGQVLADRLVESIERHGGKVLLRAAVRRILIESGRAVGIELDNPHLGRRVVRAPVVISNADLKRTILDLVGPEHFPSALVRRTRRFQMAPALGVVYLGLRRDLKAEGWPNANVWIYPSFDLSGPYREVRDGRIPREPFCFVSIATLKDPGNRKVAPPGVTNLQLMGVAPSEPESWDTTYAELASGAYRKNTAYLAHKREFAERLMDQTQRVIPELRESIVFQEVATPLTHVRYVGSTGGTAYGLAATPSQTFFRRPGAKTDIPGLLLCGANTMSGHGIAGAMSSGLMAAAELVGSALVRQTLGGPMS